MRLLAFWTNLTIAKKLYLVVGIMAVLIAGELMAVRFAMRNLSAARAFVGGESLWSKAQKDAVFDLQSFGVSKDEADYQRFLDNLQVNFGDHQARMELLKGKPDLVKLREGFLQGRIHDDDITPIVELIRRFHWISYLSRALEIWGQGDDLLYQLYDRGREYHSAIVAGDEAQARKLMSQIKTLNTQLTTLESDFSFALGEGSRWLERLVLTLLFIAVLTVESVGLGLAFITARAISRGLKDLNTTAKRIGKGDFASRVTIESKDELGQLANEVNTMGELLQKSYSDLEDKVKERTRELSQMAEKANTAVNTRDEFISIASHELKTPLTALALQLEILLLNPDDNLDEKVRASLVLTRRIGTLLDELLDVTRLQIGKFPLQLQYCDLVSVVSDCVAQLEVEAGSKNTPITLVLGQPVMCKVDRGRIGQVVTNLLSNAIKYGNSKPIEISLERKNGFAYIRVKDNGIGIAEAERKSIFERFNRSDNSSYMPGLGLGLYISDQIVKAHAGSIGVDSVIGQGSTFTVTLNAP